MPTDWKTALDAVHADEALRQHTRQFVQDRLARRQRPGRRMRRAVCAACACLAVLLLAGCGVYFTPTAVIGVDVNPSLELTVNRFDRVIRVSGRNEDGQQLADSLTLLHQTYTRAVEQVLESPAVQNCLAQDGALSLAVVEIDPGQGEAILQYLNDCTAGQENALCCALAPEEAQQARQLGLPYGKYRAYQEVLAYTDAYSPEEIAAMTMRQIRDLLARLQGEETGAETPGGTNSPGGEAPGQGCGPGNGQEGGQGNGHRYGRQ